MITAPLLGLLLVGIGVVTCVFWGGGWRLWVVLVVGFMPAFIVSQAIADWVTEVCERLFRRGRDGESSRSE